MKKQDIYILNTILNQHSAETDGFAYPLGKLTPLELLQMKRAETWVIEALTKAMRLYKPEHQTAIKKAIAYLNDLKSRQQAAIQAAEWRGKFEHILLKYATMDEGDDLLMKKYLQHYAR